MTPVEIALVSVIAYMTGVFSGIVGSIRLRKSMLRTISRETVESEHSTKEPDTSPPPVNAVPLANTSQENNQDIVIFRGIKA
jgi:hypothetical protein